MISLVDGTIRKVYNLQEEDVVVMVAAAAVILFCLTFCFLKKKLGVIPLFAEEATPRGYLKPPDKIMYFWHVVLKQSSGEQFPVY
jgi:hypothetical protein